LDIVVLGQVDTHEPLRRYEPAELDVQFEDDGPLHVEQDGSQDENAPKNIRIAMILKD